MKKFLWFEIVLVLVILISHTYAALSPEKSLMNWFRVDDAFYYFNTARNVTNGLGVTFDGINPTNGFHPLWMLICIPVFSLARFDLFLPFRLLVILMGVLNAGSAILLFQWISKVINKSAGIVAAVMWAFTPLIHAETSLSGLETGLSVFFIILLISKISESVGETTRKTTTSLILIGSIAALAFLSRLDNIFIIFMLGIWFTFSNSSIRVYLVMDVIMIMLSAYAGLLLRLGNFIDIYTFSSGLFLFIGLGLIIKIPILYFSELYQSEHFKSAFKFLKNLLVALVVGELVASIPVLILAITKTGFSFPKSLPLYDLGISILLIGGYRILIFYFSNREDLQESTPIQNLKDNWKFWLRNITFYFGILLSVMFGYMVLNTIIFQTALPVSGQIKQWWGTMYTVYGIPANTYLESLGMVKSQWLFLVDILDFPAKLFPTQFKVFLYLLELGLILFLILKNFQVSKQHLNNLLILPILGGCFWQIWSYNIRSYVGLQDWYWSTQLLLSVIFLVFLIFLFLSAIRQIDRKKVFSCLLIITICAGILLGYISSITHLINYSTKSDKEGEYLFGVSFLEQNTEPGTYIGFTGGGTIAYFIKDRTIVNLDGLINSYPYYQSLRTYRAADFLDKMGLNYIFGKPYILFESEPYKDEFSDRLKYIDHAETYSLYQYMPPVKSKKP